LAPIPAFSRLGLGCRVGQANKDLQLFISWAETGQHGRVGRRAAAHIVPMSRSPTGFLAVSAVCNAASGEIKIALEERPILDQPLRQFAGERSASFGLLSVTTMKLETHFGHGRHRGIHNPRCALPELPAGFRTRSTSRNERKIGSWRVPWLLSYYHYP